MEELVNRSISGDKAAFTELIHIIQSDLFRIAKTRLDNIEDVNDAIQETMIIAYKSMKTLKNPQFFKTWIIKILINECNKIYEKKNRKNILLDKILKFKSTPNETYTDTSSIDTKVDVNNLLESLNYEEKICIILFYNNNYSINEIAEILDTSPNTIKSRITRAKKKLKNKGGVANGT